MHLEAMTAVLSSWGLEAGSGGWVSRRGARGQSPGRSQSTFTSRTHDRWVASPALINIPHTHTFNGNFPGLPRWAGTRKVKPLWILLKQETVSGIGISWATCKSAPRSRQITTPAPHHSVFCFFLQAGCPSCRPTNSVKTPKAEARTHTHTEAIY